MRQFRQGDILIEEVAEIPSGAIQERMHHGDVLLAMGEATGHAHVLRQRHGVTTFTAEGQRYLDLRVAALLTHEEHASVLIPAGRYVIIRQREYAPSNPYYIAD
ncbi:MAG: hypothetical protein KFH87_09460 [Bacteroidetes bacterium]|nr:hypothetical protein [Bacteroidota bacterium]